MFTKQCWAWIKLATDNFSTVFTKNLRNPCDYAPLSFVLKPSNDLTSFKNGGKLLKAWALE